MTRKIAKNNKSIINRFKINIFTQDVRDFLYTEKRNASYCKTAADNINNREQRKNNQHRVRVVSIGTAKNK